MSKSIDFVCIWNIGVECKNPVCDGCGWNPEVTEARKRAARSGGPVVAWVEPVKEPERERWLIGSGQFPPRKKRKMS